MSPYSSWFINVKDGIQRYFELYYGPHSSPTFLINWCEKTAVDKIRFLFAGLFRADRPLCTVENQVCHLEILPSQEWWKARERDFGCLQWVPRQGFRVYRFNLKLVEPHATRSSHRKAQEVAVTLLNYQFLRSRPTYMHHLDTSRMFGSTLVSRKMTNTRLGLCVTSVASILRVTVQLQLCGDMYNAFIPLRSRRGFKDHAELSIN